MRLSGRVFISLKIITLMKVFATFVAVVLASSLFANLRDQYDQMRNSLVHHTEAARDLAMEKMHHTASGVKEAYNRIKEKILSKVTSKKDKKPAVVNEEEEEPDMNSSTLNEFLKKFAEEMAKHQKKMQEAGPTGNDKEGENSSETAEMLDEKQVL